MLNFLWILSIVPMLAMIPIIDSVTGLSGLIARKYEFERTDKVLLHMVLVLGFALVLFLFLSGKISTNIWDYSRGDSFQAFEIASVDDVTEFGRLYIAGYIFWFDVSALVAGLVAMAVAGAQGRPMRIWIPLALLGTVGSLIWLAFHTAIVPAWRRLAVGAGFLAFVSLVLAGAAFGLYRRDFQYSIAIANHSGLRSQVHAEFGQAVLWDGTLEPGQSHQVYTVPKKVGVLRVTLDANGRFVQHEIDDVKLECLRLFLETGYIYSACPHHIMLTIEPSLTVTSEAR